MAVVRLADTVAVDLFAGGRRLARQPAPDADPAGRLLNFTTLGLRYPILRWRNPDGRTVTHEYAVDARTLRLAAELHEPDVPPSCTTSPGWSG